MLLSLSKQTTGTKDNAAIPQMFRQDFLPLRVYSGQSDLCWPHLPSHQTAWKFRYSSFHIRHTQKRPTHEVQHASNGTLEKQSTPDNASGIIKILIHGLNLSPDFPSIQRSGKEPMIGSFTASQSLAARNRNPSTPDWFPAHKYKTSKICVYK